MKSRDFSAVWFDSCKDNINMNKNIGRVMIFFFKKMVANNSNGNKKRSDVSNHLQHLFLVTSASILKRF